MLQIQITMYTIRARSTIGSDKCIANWTLTSFWTRALSHLVHSDANDLCIFRANAGVHWRNDSYGVF